MKLTIRIGAARDEVVVDGHTFDRSRFNRHERDAFRHLIMDALFPDRLKPATRRFRRKGRKG